MLRKNIHLLYGGGIGILLIAGVIIFNRYQNLQTQEPVKVYKGTVPSKQVPKKVEPAALPQIETQPEPNTVGDPSIKETWDAGVEESEEVSEELAPVPDKSNEPSEELLATASESPQEDTKVVLLKEVFPEFDRILREGQELLEDIQEGGGWTPENRPAFEARGRALEAETYDYFQRIAEEFPGSVTFALFQGEEWTYDVDLQMLQDSIKGPIPSELEPYFRYASMRDMFGLPDIPPDFPLNDQIQLIRR